MMQRALQKLNSAFKTLDRKIFLSDEWALADKIIQGILAIENERKPGSNIKKHEKYNLLVEALTVVLNEIVVCSIYNKQSEVEKNRFCSQISNHLHEVSTLPLFASDLFAELIAKLNRNNSFTPFCRDDSNLYRQIIIAIQKNSFDYLARFPNWASNAVDGMRMVNPSSGIFSVPAYIMISALIPQIINYRSCFNLNSQELDDFLHKMGEAIGNEIADIQTCCLFAIDNMLELARIIISFVHSYDTKFLSLVMAQEYKQILDKILEKECGNMEIFRISGLRKIVSSYVRGGLLKIFLESQQQSTILEVDLQKVIPEKEIAEHILHESFSPDSLLQHEESLTSQPRRLT